MHQRRDWRSQDVAGEAFDAVSVSSIDGDIGMEAHAPFANATLSAAGAGIGSVFLLLRRVDTIAEPSPRLPCFRARGDAGANGSGHQGCKQGIVSSQGSAVRAPSPYSAR